MIQEITQQLRQLIGENLAACALLDELDRIETDGATAVRFHLSNYLTPIEGAKLITGRRRCKFAEKALKAYDVPRVGIYGKPNATHERYVYPRASIQKIDAENRHIIEARLKKVATATQQYRKHLRRKEDGSKIIE